MSAREPLDAPARRRGSRPIGTLALLAAAVTIEVSPNAAAALGFERAALARGELWRLFSGHLVHGVPRLAVLDLAALALFGAWVERASRPLLWTVLAASALLSSLAVLSCTRYERYVGSSALSSGLLVAAAVSLLRFRGAPPRAFNRRVVALVLLGLLAAKVALEFAHVWPTTLGDLPDDYESVPAAHLAGALGGAAAALALATRTRAW